VSLVGERAAAPPIRYVRIRMKVFGSSRYEVVSPLVTRRNRPSAV
jgi:hypothetical protein